MNTCIRWMLVTAAVVVVFFLGLMLGRNLPLGGVDDDDVWTIATALATAISGMAAVPLARWAERSRWPSKNA
ncbi:hypothetical protein ACWEVM_21795 [Streptomyces bauhiniae]|uniref:hypothetical protein n=1 Tax=Streptomyces bauhiniae TaxID=2340725 RepID=UPI0036CF6C58